MKQYCVGLAVWTVLACGIPALCQAPSINANGVLNNASYAGPPASGANVTIAEGSIVTIFGKNMGPATMVFAVYPLPKQLPDASGTSVKILAGGSSFDCNMWYASSGQLGCIVPSTVPVGTATFTVTYNGQTSSGQAVNMVKQNFALLTQNQGGTGPATAQTVQGGNVVWNGLSTSAREGQVLTLFGTGLGPISGPDNVPPGAINLASGVKVVIGGQSLASGGGACTHPLGLSPSALAQLDAGGNVTIGLALAGRFGLGLLGFPGYADGAGAAFFQGNANEIYLATMSLASLGDATVFDKPGTCVAYNAFTQANPTALSGLSFNYAHLLDAGSSLTISGPGATKTMASVLGGYGTSGSSQFLANGGWTITGTGGNDIGPFTANLNIPVLTWTNAVAPGSVVSRSAPLVVNWTGGGPTDIVAIAGASVAIDINRLDDPNATFDWVFNCYAAASAGTFTVPTNILQKLPTVVTSTVVGTGGILVVSAGNSAGFTAPLKKGGQIDAGVWAWGATDTRPVSWQ